MRTSGWGSLLRRRCAHRRAFDCEQAGSLLLVRAWAREALFVVARFLYRLPSFSGRNRLFAVALGLAQRLGPPIVVEVDGFTLQLDLRDGLCRDMWVERDFGQGRMLKALCEPGDVVIDVGANVGYMALIAAREVGPAGRVVAIEPGERSFSLLEINAARNFPDRITVMRAACDEADGTATLYVSGYSEELNSLRPDMVLGRVHEEVVPARSLRSVCDELRIAPTVAKIDVEGAEWAVLRGLFDGDDVPPPRALLVEAYEGNTRGLFSSVLDSAGSLQPAPATNPVRKDQRTLVTPAFLRLLAPMNNALHHGFRRI
jgi:FkbM family methyltransferase